MDKFPPRSIGQALLLWIAFVLIFLFFGGLGAGLTTLAYEAVSGNELQDVVYAIFFAAHGFIAYQLAAAYLGARS